ncbi:type IV secretion system protein VirB10 [Novosphingobium profundi]|uniref:type IV secretion system protein VirB10 n=1 Tax=Novosphingobium profundi TaxID=1774954 RepID=UPI001BDA44A6|nr:type IV secretion system protein VirB10 [Novosphingobium profundi]MBT0671342.1 type IV secretion system protein VirB10 [Novosphingobium profundi]
MAENVIDRGGELAPADSIPEESGSPAGRSSTNWGNVAFVGAGVGLVATILGIFIGYGVFHNAVSAKAAEEPAQASQKSVDDVVASPAAQRAALAGQLEQAGSAQTDVFGRPVLGQQTTDANGNPVPATGEAASGEENLAQKRYEERLKMADAARRAPVMAYQANGLTASAAPVSPTGNAAAAGPHAPESGPHNFGASGFGPPSDGDTGTGSASKGSTDFTDQLGHAKIETVRASLIKNRDFLLSAGTVIPCTLQTAINSTQAGFVSCVINHDVYSEDGHVVLLDKGTKVLGQYSGGITQGQARMFVLWTRALTPRGVAIDLGSPAADALGRSGMSGGVDTQFWARFGAALMMSVLEDASNIAGRAVANQGTYTTQVPSEMGNTILRDSKNIKPILKKNQGDSAAIFVAKDFDFSPVYDLKLSR